MDFFYVLVMMPVLVATSLRGRIVPTLLGWAPLRLLGEISYSVYLLHFPFLILFKLVSAWIGIEVPGDSVARMLVFVCVTLGVSYLSWRFYEKPAQAWLNTRFSRHATARRTDM